MPMDPDFPQSSGPSDQDRGSGSRFGGDQGWPRWMIGVLAAVIIAVIFLPSLLATQSGNAITYGDYMAKLNNNEVATSTFDVSTGAITGTTSDGKKFTSNGPLNPPDADLNKMTEKGVKFQAPDNNMIGQLITLLLPALLIIGFFVWMQRRASSQMGG